MEETVSEQKVDFDKIETCIKETSDDFIKTQENLFNSLKEEFSGITKIKNFNSLAELYEQSACEKERILEWIEHLKIEKICNPAILKDFFLYIGIDADTIKKSFPNLSDLELESDTHIKVIRGPVHLVIKNETHCVIIEIRLYNEIYSPFAYPYPPQVYYYENKSTDMEVVKFVYVTLLPCAELNFDEVFKNNIKDSEYYSERMYKNICLATPELENKLVYLSAINKCNEKSLCNFFNDEIEKKDNELMKRTLNKYSKLFSQAGGIEKMLETEATKLVEKIYESKESLQNAKLFLGIWMENSCSVVENLLEKKFNEEYADKGWELKGSSFIKTAKKISHGNHAMEENLKFFITLSSSAFFIGFRLKNWKENSLQELKKFLENIDFDLTPFRKVAENEEVYICFDYEKDSLNEKFEKASSALNKLLDSYKSFEK